jgi:hypothetical protein
MGDIQHFVSSGNILTPAVSSSECIKLSGIDQLRNSKSLTMKGQAADVADDTEERGLSSKLKV